MTFRARKAPLKAAGRKDKQHGLVIDLEIIILLEIIFHPEGHKIFHHVLFGSGSPAGTDLKHDGKLHVFLILGIEKCLVETVTATKILHRHGLSLIGGASVPAVDKAVDTVLHRPFDLPVAHLGIFLVVIAHQRRSVGIDLCKVVEALMDLRRAVFPCRIIMRRHDPI